ncbi:hypothetical protein WH52_13020 [Tenacibaculum holothuriorum]|uniref:DUF5689 domain-containing protein n=1 Tax=Tenacibaculum holothuriorum TaxID=1635173 RepID=A0A1Y2PBW4_9FLAO|nr:DUF5689 domain-containing protein [Tenacibaculum holothuriorum]OSY87178.1 hypothetical protein WH52_13020 [Tenacibaculum holothuriorum]
MKIINKFNIILAAVVASIVFTSCVDNNDYTVPTIIGDEENTSLNAILDSIATKDTWNLISIADVKAKYNSGDAPVKIETNDVVKGYVVSSDQSGNFYREFYIQDAPENPTAGLKVIVNLTNNYSKFNFGREVYISLKDLYLGETNSRDGITTVAGRVKTSDTNEVDVISENQMVNHIFRAATTATIVPKTISLSELSSTPVGTYVRVNNAFFSDALVGEPIVDPNEDFDTQRTVMSCSGFDFSEGIIETSSFASFASSKLPADGGYIEAVVSKDFRGDNAVLVLNSFSDIVFNETKCQPLNIDDFEAVFNEDFQVITRDNTSLSVLPNWVNFAQEGGEVWLGQEHRGNGYVEFSGFRTGDDSNIGWLITPGIDMDAQTNEFLNFKAAQHHVDNSSENTLEVLVSTDFDGTNVAAATWTKVSASLPTQDSSWYQFQDSGLIDISEYTGTLYVAFKSVASGNNTSLDGAYMIDDVQILAKK